MFINGHFSINDNKFREFFNFNRQQFYFVSSLVKNPFKNEPSLRVPDPITSDEKSVITLT